VGGSSKPSSPLHHTVREERKVLRYTFEGVPLNERARIALGMLSSDFRSERGVQGCVSGDLAHALGDGNGWNAYPTAMALLKRGWAARGGTRGADYQQTFRYTDAGMAVLFELDKQWREREACPTCRGESKVRSQYDFSERLHLALLCPGCGGTLLVRRAKQD
jgi:hypothetical protein